MAEQLLYNGARRTQYKDYEIPRGDVREFDFTHDLGAAGNIKEARLELENAAGTAVLQLTLADHASQFDFSTSGEGEITLLSDDTGGLTAGAYSYAVELIDYDDYPYTVLQGTLDVRHAVIDDSSDAAYLSWTTLETFNSQLNALLANHNAGTVTTAASSGASTIDVDGADDLFSAADTIWIQLGALGSVTGETHDIDSISGDTITLDATTLGDDVAAGAVVQLMV